MSDDFTPYEPEQLDDLLSAELDGELDAVAADLGVSVEEITARLRATPDVDSRRAALAAARDLLAQPFEVDELVLARIRAKAMREVEDANSAEREERKRRRQRVFLSAGGVAAAVAVVVALAAGMSGTQGNSKSASAPISAAAAPEKSSGAPDNGASTGAKVPTALGRFTDAHQLALAAVSRQDARFAPAGDGTTRASSPGSGEQVKPATTTYGFATTTAPATNPVSSGTTAPLKAPSTTQRNAGTADSAIRAANAKEAARKCLAPAYIPVGPTPALRATATLAGRHVVVLVYTDNGEHTVVIEALDCTLLNWQTLG